MLRLLLPKTYSFQQKNYNTGIERGNCDPYIGNERADNKICLDRAQMLDYTDFKAIIINIIKELKETTL